MSQVSFRFTLAVVLLSSSVIMGGGGWPDPGMELGAELVALLVFCACALVSPPQWETIRRDSLPWSLLAVVTAVPLLQLVPLPHLIWAALPGRGDAAAVVEAIGMRDAWHPFALGPDRTLASVLSLLPPFVMIFLVADLPAEQRIRLIMMVVAAGLASALLGLFQFAGGLDGRLNIYPYAGRGAVGFFANRAAQSALIAIGLTALVLLFNRFWRRMTSPVAFAVFAALGLLLLVCGLAAGSRTGVAVLLVPLALAALILPARRKGGRAGRLAVALGALMVATLVGIFLLQSTALRATGDRFVTDSSEARRYIWRDTIEAIGQTWPVGTGMGGFVPAYAAVERLENVSVTYANRAHDEYLEVALESGVFGLIVLATAIAFILVRGLALWRLGGDCRLFGGYSLASSLVIALHSISDYPLRTLSLSVVLAVGFGSTIRPVGVCLMGNADKHTTVV